MCGAALQETWVGLNFSDIGDLSELETAKYTLESADGDGTVTSNLSPSPPPSLSFLLPPSLSFYRFSEA
jgi:hypothetical protein